MPYPGMEKPEIRYNIFEPVLTSRFRLQHLYSWRFFRSRGKIMTCLEELYTGNGVALTKSDVLYVRLGYCVCYYVNCISLNMRMRCYVILMGLIWILSVCSSNKRKLPKWNFFIVKVNCISENIRQYYIYLLHDFI